MIDGVYRDNPRPDLDGNDGNVANFAHYRDMLATLNEIAEQLKSFEVPDREMQTFTLGLGQITYSDFPVSIRDLVIVDQITHIDVTITNEFTGIPEGDAPEGVAYSLSFTLYAGDRILSLSRDYSSVPMDLETLSTTSIEPLSHGVITETNKPNPLQLPGAISTGDLQRIVLIGCGFSSEKLSGVDMDAHNIFLFEKRAALTEMLYERALSRLSVRHYEIDGMRTTLTFLNGEIQTLTIQSDDPKQSTHVDLQRGLDISFRTPDTVLPDESDVVKFNEAIAQLLAAIKRRRPSIVSGSPLDLDELTQTLPGATLI